MESVQTYIPEEQTTQSQENLRNKLWFTEIVTESAKDTEVVRAGCWGPTSAGDSGCDC
ncbi:hypothetical protein [Thioflexithrix psekupsensis]|uniref:hypothetical protein n=1 Tax=Thioflexithrix psekupsensis TaxID=1570016 RepID=UPI001594489A|nr:hypothetical protein [Thioflexithrix psekupsensis]